MKINESISVKLNDIIRKKDISVNKLANMCCLTQSTVDSLVNGKSKNPKLLTIVRICDGLNITLKEFFDDEIFKNIDRED
ncbi:MAG: helix-turn-helix transcriptional regulator [Bacilli bacterium]|nr:helix-turn-helix transcriptional regulator [Bacilli bacterium]